MATNITVTRVAQTHRCHRCLSTDIDHSSTETWCQKCGFVLEDSPVDHGPDWDTRGGPETNSERAAPGNRNHHDRGLGTDYQPESDDPDDTRRAKIATHTRLGDKRARNRGYATGDIHRMTGALDLPRWIGERAKHLFRELHAEGLNGYDLDAVSAACLFAACRESQQGRTAEEVAEVARTDTSDLRRRYQWTVQQLGLAVPPPDIAQRVRVVASKLPADPDAVDKALTGVSDTSDETLAGSAPSVVAATLLYQAGEWTQAVVCETAGVTPPALRNCRDRL